MFFHRIERLDNMDDATKELISEVLKGHHYTIIPLVKPGCAVGEYLMDREQSEFISKYSGKDVTIFYTDKKMKGRFDQFMAHIFSEVRKISGEDIKEPGLLIFFPHKERVVIIEVAVQDEPRKFRTVMFQLIDALQSGDPPKNITRLKYEVNMSHIETDNSNFIKELHLYVIKFFV